jgi:hypothetical protein
MTTYETLYNAIAKANEKQGLNAMDIARGTKATGSKNGIKYLNIGGVVVAYSSDKQALQANRNRACSIARQQTASMRNGMSYGVPNCVSQVYSDYSAFVGIEKIGFASQAYKLAYIRKYLQGEFYFLIGQGISNNFHEIINGDYNIVNSLEDKRDIWG